MKGTHLHPAIKRPGAGLGIDTQQQTGVPVVSAAKEKPFLFATPRDGHESDRHQARGSVVGFGEIRIVVLELKEMQEPKKRVPFVDASAASEKTGGGTVLHGIQYVQATSRFCW